MNATITSRQNPQVKAIARLRERRERDRQHRFLIEGYRELQRALAGGVVVEQLYICEPLFLGVNEPTLIDAARRAGATVIGCAEAPFRKLSYRDRPDGLIGVAEQWQRHLSHLPQQENALYIIAEAIEKPGNLGTILRSSDATGVTGVIVCDRCTDIYNPNVVRASVGTLFTLPVVEASGVEVRHWLRERSIRLVAATPDAAQLYTDADLTGPLAIAFGTEQLGLSPQLLAAADLKVYLPMQGVADSLNVAMATTVLLYEAWRQRW